LKLIDFRSPVSLPMQMLVPHNKCCLAGFGNLLPKQCCLVELLYLCRLYTFLKLGGKNQYSITGYIFLKKKQGKIAGLFY